MKCAEHPDIETSLRCGKCNKPICPKCLVQTPVGDRCQDCAKLYQLPTYHVSTKYYLRATGASLGMAIISGAVWGTIIGLVPFFYLNLLLAPGAGYAIGEVVSLATNRKRGTGLAIVAGTGMMISYLTNILLLSGLPFGIFHIILDLLALGLGIFFAINRLH